eukprot:820161_1
MADYAKKTYWNERYRKEPETFEWYQSYDTIKALIDSFITKDSKVLVVGCGSSSLSEDIYDSCTKDVTSIDFAFTAIDMLNEKAAGKVGLQFITMDVQSMEFPNENFDIVIDKGTLDSVLVSCPPAQTYAAVACQQLLVLL